MTVVIEQPGQDGPQEEQARQEHPARQQAQDQEQPQQEGEMEAASDEGEPPAVELDEPELDLGPEKAVAESLQSALRQLRDDADRLAAKPLDEAKVAEAERLAERAAALDEQIGSMARKDEG